MVQEAIKEVLADSEPVTLSVCRSIVQMHLGEEVSEDAFMEAVYALGDIVYFNTVSGKIALAQSAGKYRFPIEREIDLEDWFERYLVRQTSTAFFDPTPPSLSVVIQNTARVGRSYGLYTRPDICMATVSRYNYAPTAELELFSFELKLATGCNNESVMQALANGTHAHFTYLGIHEPDTSHLNHIRHQASHHGVGIIAIHDPRADHGYNIVLPARRQKPRLADTERFIDSRFSEMNRNNLRNWIRS